jgi:predicted DNA-binding protein (MmcQ/YjbR family)
MKYKELFFSYRVIKDKLLYYGFTCFSNVYTYAKDFMNDEFQALIIIDEHDEIDGKVVEKAFDEEYHQIENESFRGGFVGAVREAYQEILLDIRDKCFKKEIFISDQANRLAKLIKERYDESPDFPFADPHIKNYGVFRYRGNDKWYGLVMNINKSVFIKDKNDEYIDVINVRIDENKREEIINYQSIFPSYHMNKQKWIAIMLDGSVDLQQVCRMIDASFLDTASKKKKDKFRQPKEWIVPANPKYYDIEAAFDAAFLVPEIVYGLGTFDSDVITTGIEIV